MKKYILFALGLLLLISCSEDKNSGNPELIGKTFDHRFFETEAECLASQTNPNFFINCHEQIRFIDAATAEIMITDMLQVVSYTVDDTIITISFPGTSPTTLVFERLNDSSLRLQGNNTVWNKRIGNSVWN